MMIRQTVFLILAALAFASPVFAAEASAPPPLELTASDAVLAALRNNKSLHVRAIEPAVSLTREVKADAAFDPALSSGVTHTQSVTPPAAETRKTQGEVELSKKLFSGSEITLDIASGRTSGNRAGGAQSTRLAVSFSKPFLRGGGRDVNLAALNQAKLDTISSTHELQAFTETLILEVTRTYWDYALAQREIEIYENSLEVAKQQLREAELMVEIGRLAEVELVAAKSEAALREQSLVSVRGRRDALRLKLLAMISPPQTLDAWETRIDAVSEFSIPSMELGGLVELLDAAMENRPDLVLARLTLERGALDVVRTRNGLLPYLDFFVTLGGTGYAGSFRDSAGGVFSDGEDLSLGFTYNAALGRRDARAGHEQSLLKIEQNKLAVENMALTVQEDVRAAWIELDTAKKQIEASRAVLMLQDEKLRRETEKFRVGRSTSLNVAQAQRDYLQAQVDEARTIADYSVDLISLYKSTGTLAERYGALSR